jgi:hypothetical protein
MYVTAGVEGKSVTNASEVVWRRGCEMFESPPPDSLLSNGVMLNVLEDLAKDTPFSGPFRSRRERGGYLLRELDGRVTYREFDYLDGMPTPCNSNHRDQIGEYQRQGLTVVAEIHSHPSAGGHTYMDNLDGLCTGWERDSRLEFYDGPSGRGRSPGDLDPWERETNPHEHTGYIVDPEHVHRWGRGAPTIEKLNLNRGPNRCIV